MANLSKVKYFLLVILILIFPLGEISRVDLGNAIAFTLNDLLVGTIAFIFILQSLLGRTVKGSLKKPILIFILVCLLSLMANIANLTGLKLIISASYLLRWALYATIYFAVMDLTHKQKSLLTKTLFISGAITVIMGLTQLLLYPNLRNLFYAGWDEHLYRIFAGFLDPNFTGIILVLFFILTLAYSKNIKFFEKNRRIYLLLLSSIIVSIVLTFSRTAIFAFFSSFAVYILLNRKWKVLYVYFLILFLIGFFYIIIPKKESNNIFRTTSTFARVSTYKEGFSIFNKNPVLGVGFNSYRYALEKYGYIDKMTYGPSHGKSGNDNSFIFILATTGIVGLFSYLYLLYRQFKIASRSRELVVVSMFVVLIGGFFVNALFFVFIMEWIWIILGITESN